MDKLDEILEVYVDVEFQIISGHDNAIVGVGDRFGSEPFLIYDKTLILEELMHRDKMGYEEALEYFYHNILGSYVGEHTPAFITIA
tara:strand:- start:2013 stop:2270 length:258 start_codon:yes stop_codon:yes gene_type:complete